jgi:hypothetical protein
MHHQWNIENPLLFNSVVRRWISDASLHQILVDPQAAKPEKPARATKPSGAQPEAAEAKPHQVDPQPAVTQRKPELPKPNKK